MPVVSHVVNDKTRHGSRVCDRIVPAAQAHGGGDPWRTDEGAIRERRSEGRVNVPDETGNHLVRGAYQVGEVVSVRKSVLIHDRMSNGHRRMMHGQDDPACGGRNGAIRKGQRLLRQFAPVFTLNERVQTYDGAAVQLENGIERFPWFQSLQIGTEPIAVVVVSRHNKGRHVTREYVEEGSVLGRIPVICEVPGDDEGIELQKKLKLSCHALKASRPFRCAVKMRVAEVRDNCHESPVSWPSMPHPDRCGPTERGAVLLLPSDESLW